MIIKSFVGASVAEALKLIRSELGPRAVVLKTRSLGAGESGAGKRMVEITACLERPTVGALQESMSGPTPQGFERLTRIKKLAEPEHETPNRPEAVNAAAGPGLEPPGVNLNDTEEFARRLEEKLDLILDAQVRPSGLEDYPAEVVELAGMLLEHDIPERLLRPLVKRINGRLKASDGDVGGKTSREFAEEIMVEEFARRCLPDFALKAGDLAVFIGPSGSGKTS
ncbi:MAG: hypothetical protein ACE5GA_11035, partial [Candidatus Zixiibacteriota bacterium]